MAIYPVSLLLSLLLLLPVIAERMDWEIPFQGVLAVPATGLSYMGTFFHELGHSIVRWLFGYPAVPTFDFQHGGGMTYDFERPEYALYGVYLLAALGCFYLFSKRRFGLLIGSSVFILVHLALAFNQGHDVLMLYMGHGAEILVGSFCVLRGIIGHDEYGAAERWLNMVFGLFIIGKNMLMSCGLMFDDVMRYAYEEQKGGHGFGDFSRIADIMNVKIESVAAFSFLFAVLFLVLAVFFGLREKRLA